VSPLGAATRRPQGYLPRLIEIIEEMLDSLAE